MEYFSPIKEGNPTIFNYINESGGYNTQWNKSSTKQQNIIWVNFFKIILIEAKQQWLPGASFWDKKDIGKLVESFRFKMNNFGDLMVTVVNNTMLYTLKYA
jgi:hypothetical protein